MTGLFRRGRALSVMAAALVLLVAVSLAYLLPGRATSPSIPRAAGSTAVGPADFLSAGTGWLARGSTVLATSDGGRHWRPILNLPYLAVGWLRLFDERHGLVFGSDQVNAGHGQRLVRTDDGGASWVEEHLPATGWLVQPASLLAFPDRSHGWYVVGEASGAGPRDLNLYRTDDGGTSWERMESLDFLHPSDGGLVRGGVPVELEFSDRQQGWLVQASVVVSDAVLSMTTDGGASWRPVSLAQPPGDRRPLADPRVPQVFSDGIALLWSTRGFLDPTAYVYRSVDGGQTWGSPVQLPAPGGPTAFVDSTHWWRVAGVAVELSSDGGRTWHTGGPTPDGHPLAWLQPLGRVSGWAITATPGGNLPAGQVLRTDDGAEHWQAVPIDSGA
ncbi:MAG: hypothetical protein JOZ82_13905 [Marmoricola sp.]|nr:hypothetical protein [Marmoricola sp.]